MKIPQLSIFMENRSGRLARIAAVLGNSGINIRAMSLADTSDFGILRLVVSDVGAAEKILKDQGFTVRLSEVIAAAIPDTPGALGNLLTIAEIAGLNVEYMYAFVEKKDNEAVLIFRFDDLDRAIETMLESGIKVLKTGELLKL